MSFFHLALQGLISFGPCLSKLVVYPSFLGSHAVITVTHFLSLECTKYVLFRLLPQDILPHFCMATRFPQFGSQLKYPSLK